MRKFCAAFLRWNCFALFVDWVGRENMNLFVDYFDIENEVVEVALNCNMNFFGVVVFLIFSLNFPTKRLTTSAVSLSTCVEEDHTKRDGVNIVCCDGATNSRDGYLSSNLHCTPAVACQCYVEILPELKNCVEELRSAADEPPILAKNNASTTNSSTPAPFAVNGTRAATPNCTELGFRNLNAEYSVHIREWNQRSVELLDGLSKYNVTKLVLNIPSPSEGSPSLEIPNFGLFFPELRHLFVSTTFVRKSERISRAKIATTQFLRDLRFLKALKMIGVDFEFDEIEEASWIASIQQLHVEGSSLNRLPWWFGRAAQLERLTIRHTRLDSALVASQIPSISYVNLVGNRVGDLDRISFASTRIHEMDLAGNRITKFAFHTFAQCSQLRRLDLSDNPIESLPEKAFYANSRLKTLRIENTHITELEAAHFVGLSALNSLSLSGNFFRDVEAFAFLPIRSVRTLSMNKCNLTSIPLAVTQCCHLESLSLNENLFYGRDSMPAEVLAMLSKLRHFDFARNPLMRLPPGLFLFPVGLENFRHHSNIILEIVENLIELPVWLAEPCTPFFWYLHLRNSSYELRTRLSLWDEKRMNREKLTHCQELYATIMDSIGLYTELAANSGCEATRRLRSVITANHQCQCWNGNDSATPLGHKKQRHRPSGGRVIVKNLNTDGKQYPSMKYEKIRSSNSIMPLPKLRYVYGDNGSGMTSAENKFTPSHLQSSDNSTLERIPILPAQISADFHKNVNFALIVSITMNFVLLILTTSLLLYNFCRKSIGFKATDSVDCLTPLKRDINTDRALYSESV